MLKVSEIKMSVDKVLALAKTITTIQIKLPLNKEVYTQTMLMARHQKIAKLFDEDFWVRNDEVRRRECYRVLVYKATKRKSNHANSIMLYARFDFFVCYYITLS